ncbi:MAG TPA: hypothetical protein VGE77_09405 [Nocardioides sp.]
MTAVRRVLAATATLAGLGAMTGCGPASVGESTLARADDGTYVMLVEICRGKPEVVVLTIDDLWEAEAPDAGRSYAVVLSGLDVSAVPRDEDLYVGGWTEDINHTLYGPNVSAGEVADLRPGELFALDDDGDYRATTTTEADWRADAC